MAYISVDFTFANGQTADGPQVSSNFTNLTDGLSDGSKDININDATFAGTVLVGSGAIDVEKSLVPIGSIIPHYDFDAALSYDSTYWKPCDGGSYTIGGASRTAPDVSNRYLVGFGTEGGGDVDSAAWATAAVGNASHETDISHTHTGPSHTHDSQGHSHNIANQAGGSAYEYVVSTSAPGIANNLTTIGSTSVNGANDLETTASGTGATGSGGSATQDIQVRSVRVRWIMRAK